MYLTAHRVYSLAKQKAGINVFLYRHGEQPVPGMSWEQPVVELVADEHIGTRGPEHVEVAPGGNRVLSFIDIVTADDTSLSQVEAATEAFGKSVSSADRLPVSSTIGNVALRFGAQFGLDKKNQRLEFEELVSQALALLNEPHEPQWRSREPLEVDVEETEEGLRFALRPEAQHRLAAVHGVEWSAPRVSISHDTHHAFELAQGDVFRNFVPILANLDLEYVAGLGGMRFLKAGTGELLAEWPSR